MASHWQTPSITKLLIRDATDAIDLDGDTLKIGLSTAVHVSNKDEAYLSEGGSDDFSDGELSGVGYVGGFAGAGRKTLAGVTCATDAAADRTKFTATNPSAWLTVYPVTIAQATILKERTSDVDSPTLINLDFPDVDPNGNDFAISFHTDGIGYIQT